MSLSTKEREKRVLECLEQNKNYREIQAQLHISSREVSSIAKKAKEKKDKEEEKKLQRSLTSKAYKLFAKGKDLLHVATTLGIGAPETKKLYLDYLDLKGYHHIAEVLQQFDIQTIKNFSKSYTTNDNRIDEKKLIEAIKISTGLPKIKEEYNNKSSQLRLLQEQLTFLREQIDLFSSRNNFLLHKNLELLDEFNFIRNKIKEDSIGILKTKDPFIRSSIITILKIIKDDPEKEILINNNNNNNNKNNNNLHSFDQKISEMVAKFIDTISETIVNSIINSKNNNYNTYNSQEKV